MMKKYGNWNYTMDLIDDNKRDQIRYLERTTELC